MELRVGLAPAVQTAAAAVIRPDVAIGTDVDACGRAPHPPSGSGAQSRTVVGLGLGRGRPTRSLVSIASAASVSMFAAASPSGAGAPPPPHATMTTNGSDTSPSQPRFTAIDRSSRILPPISSGCAECKSYPGHRCPVSEVRCQIPGSRRPSRAWWSSRPCGRSWTPAERPEHARGVSAQGHGIGLCSQEVSDQRGRGPSAPRPRDGSEPSPLDCSLPRQRIRPHLELDGLRPDPGAALAPAPFDVPGGVGLRSSPRTPSPSPSSPRLGRPRDRYPNAGRTRADMARAASRTARCWARAPPSHRCSPNRRSGRLSRVPTCRGSPCTSDSSRWRDRSCRRTSAPVPIIRETTSPVR